MYISSNNRKIDGQLTLYFKRVIDNAASNHYKKKTRYQDREVFFENIDQEIVDIIDDSILTPTIVIFGLPLSIEDDSILKKIERLTEREKFVLVEKFLLGKTDKEIGRVFGITRQGVTNLKHRTLKKIRE